jgi:hypothetical protein
MVNQHIQLSGEVSADATDEIVDSITPSSGETITTVGVYFDPSAASSEDDVEFSLFLEEQTLIDSLPGGRAATRDRPLALDLRLEAGDELRLGVTETASSDTDVAAVFLAENTNLPQA